jgi:hypothetical protein
MARQMKIPGTEQDEIPELEAKAEVYITEMTKRVRQSKKEVSAKIDLINTMKEHKKFIYRLDDGSIITLASGKENIKVTHDDEEADDEGEESPALEGVKIRKRAPQEGDSKILA